MGILAVIFSIVGTLVLLKMFTRFSRKELNKLDDIHGQLVQTNELLSNLNGNEKFMLTMISSHTEMLERHADLVSEHVGQLTKIINEKINEMDKADKREQGS